MVLNKRRSCLFCNSSPQILCEKVISVLPSQQIPSGRSQPLFLTPFLAPSLASAQRPLHVSITMTQQDASSSTLGSKEASVNGNDAITKENPPQFKRGPRFWLILFILALVSLLTSLEATVTSTILPSIVADLNGGENYVWIANATFLTM